MHADRRCRVPMINSGLDFKNTKRARRAEQGSSDGSIRSRDPQRDGRRWHTRAALSCRHRHPARRHRRYRPTASRRRQTGNRRRRLRRRARLRRPPHALRCTAVLGPLLHAVRLARHHVGGDRQLRVRLRASAARRARTGDVVDDARRSDSLCLDEGRHAVGLDHLPRIPRQRRPRAESHQPAALCAHRSPADLGDGHGSGEGRQEADRGRTCGNLPAVRGIAGRRRLRLVRPAPDADGPRRRAARLRRHTDGDRHHAR